MRHFIDVIKEVPEIIFDIGSRDGAESVTLAECYPDANIYSFECNPATTPLLVEKSQRYPNIHPVLKAVNDFSGKCTFRPINAEKSISSWEDKNPGASSLLRISENYPSDKLVQDEIEVECIRLDKFCTDNKIEKIDVIWMDVQGAEMIALKSLGKLLATVKYICLEVSFREMYKGQCMFREVHEYMTNNGFTLINSDETFERERDNYFQTDAIYKSNK